MNVEILPNVWQVRQDLAPLLPGTYTVIDVLIGSRILIIDTGLPNGETTVLNLIESLGRQPSDVVTIVNSHGHGDHIGANVALARATGAQVAIHEKDAFYLEGANQKWGDTPIVTTPPDRRLSDGDVVEFGDERLEVIHLPGHSGGSIGLCDRQRRILYSGDALQGRGTNVQHLAFYVDPDAYGKSVRKARALEIEHLVPAHPYLPLTESVVSGDGVAAYLDVCQTVYDEMDPQVLDVLATAGRPLRAEEVAVPLCQRNGFDSITGMATATVRGHLERLRRAGEVRADGEGAAAAWERK